MSAQVPDGYQKTPPIRLPFFPFVLRAASVMRVCLDLDRASSTHQSLR